MKPKLVSVSTSELVILAVHELESMKLHALGPTSKDIVELISNKYKVNNEEIKAEVREALLRGVTFGIFSEKDGRYRLEEVPEPPLQIKPSQMSDTSMVDPGSPSAMSISPTGRRKRKRDAPGSEFRPASKPRSESNSRAKKNCKETKQGDKKTKKKAESEPESVTEEEEEEEDEENNF